MIYSLVIGNKINISIIETNNCIKKLKSSIILLKILEKLIYI
jgi:hypothetical protein